MTVEDMASESSDVVTFSRHSMTINTIRDSYFPRQYRYIS